MSRIKIEQPGKFTFSTTIDVRITDINYGGHVGNDTILSLIHESRMRFLKSLGYSELDCGGTGLIMSDVAIEFKNELFYGDHVNVHIAVSEITKVGFNLFYKLEKKNATGIIVVAFAKTGMVCYDYQRKKISTVPQGVREKMAVQPD